MICDKIKQLRVENKITQSELGKKLGVSRTSVNAWEMGVSIPSLQVFIELARLFKVSVDYMLELDSDMKISIGHLSKSEKQLILDMIKHFDRFHEARKFIRAQENKTGQMTFDDEWIRLFLEKEVDDIED